MIRFWELARCAGVDEDEQPFPGMVVPYQGANVVVLDTEGADLQVVADHRGVEIEEFDAADLRKALNETNTELSKPDVDAQYRASLLPRLVSSYSKPRFFRIHGKKHVIGFPGAQLQAKSKKKVETTLRVVVLDAMTVKIAIRNVTVRDDQGAVVYHAAKPCDPEKERDGMNAVWIPQTNMSFELVPSQPAFIDIRDKATRTELGKGFGLRDPDGAVFPPELTPAKMEEVFKKHLVADAALTFFLVDKLRGGDSGLTLPSGMAFIRGNHSLTTFAHEAGHFLGGSVVKGAWDDLHHTYDKDEKKDLRMLMRDGGAGWKIPFKQAELFRGFFKRHTVH